MSVFFNDLRRYSMPPAAVGRCLAGSCRSSLELGDRHWALLVHLRFQDAVPPNITDKYLLSFLEPQHGRRKARPTHDTHQPIAHRLSTVRTADRIIVVDDGRVIQTGSHEELLAAEGLYRQLVERQLAA